MKKQTRKTSFDDVEILTKRPENMPYKQYKELLKKQRDYLKRYKKGIK